ncbi:MAG: hypothetical protein ACKVQU_24060 [Burkholderiales bacterium]
MLEVRQCRIRPTQLAPSEGKAEEHAFVDRSDSTLGFIDRQVKPPIEVRGQIGLDALARAQALHENQQIVGVSREAMSASLQ